MIQSKFTKTLALIWMLSFLMQSSFLIAEESPDHPIQLPGYNITSSDSHKFIWFRVAKAGTRSILDVLQKNTELSKHGFNIRINLDEYGDYYKFAFVRNPWDRVVSCYHNKVLTKNDKNFQRCFGKNFEFFVDFINSQDLTKGDFHIKLQTKLIPVERMNFIGRLENFNEDLKFLLSVIGLKDQEIPHKNRSEHKHYSTYYTERTKEIIAQKYKEDIETFGYTFEVE